VLLFEIYSRLKKVNTYHMLPTDASSISHYFSAVKGVDSIKL